MSDTYTRREFLRRSGLTGLALAAAQNELTPFGRLPIGTASAPKRVVIVGAGLAGLVAAFELVRAGHDVIVLEARDRPGGRVHTLRSSFADGLHAEAGAARIPDVHDLTMGYARQFGLRLLPFEPDAPRTIYARGRRYRSDDWQTTALVFDLSGEERTLGEQGLAAHFLEPLIPQIGDVFAPGWPHAALRRFDDDSAQTFLQRRSMSQGAVDYLDLGLDLLDHVSMLFMLSYFALTHRAGEYLKIDGGNDRLPAAFAERLGERIRYRATVSRIEQDAHGVRAIIDRAGARDIVGADHLLCTVPFTVLRRMEVMPSLPNPLQQAVEQLAYDAITRVFLQTRTRFWLEAGLSGFARTDHAMEVFDSTFGQPGTRGILMGYAHADFARRLQALGGDERVHLMTREMDRVFPGAAREVERGVSWCWNCEPWSRGAFAAYAPGQMIALYPHVSVAHGRMHFAGEHASIWPGWMQGALSSGLRAAKEIAESA